MRFLKSISIISLFVAIFWQAFLLPSHAQSVGNTFKITTSIIGDISPPTVPQNLVGVAVAYDQIDLTWDASTDDTYITGYNIYRDSIFIINVPGTNYSDISLDASTWYDYNITAVDSVGNESGMSNTATVKTLDYISTPTTTPPSGGSSGSRPRVGSLPINITEFSLIPGYYSAYIYFKTDNPARWIIKWGDTTDYEIGISSSKFLSKTHVLFLDNLSPGKQYFYTLYLYDGIGRLARTYTSNFFTPSIPWISYLPNVRDLSIEAVPKDGLAFVTLKWKYPDVENEGVIVLRTLGHYPIDIYDGKIVYEGKTDSFSESVDKDTDYYYTVFVKYKGNKLSSGAIIRKPQIKDSGKDDLTSIPDYIPLSKILVEQNGQIIRPINKLFGVVSLFPIQVSIKKSDIQSEIESMVINIESYPDFREKSTYLFAYNLDKIRYETSFNLSPNLQYRFTILYLDGKKEIRGKTEGFFKVKEVTSQFNNQREIGWYGILIDFLWLIILIIILIVLYLIYKLVFSRDKKKKEVTVLFDEGKATSKYKPHF